MKKCSSLRARLGSSLLLSVAVFLLCGFDSCGPGMELQRLFGDFSIKIGPGSQTVAQGGTATYTVTVIPENGFFGVVDLFCAGDIPQPLFGSCNPGSVTLPGPGTSTLTIHTSCATPPNTYRFDVHGVDEANVNHAETVTLTVTNACQPDFTISAVPSSQSVAAGSTATYTVTVTPKNGFTGPVTLSAVPSAGLGNPGLSPMSVTLPAGGTSTLTVPTTTATPVGTYGVTIVGMGGAFTHGTDVTLMVTPPPNFSLASSPSAQTVTAGDGTFFIATVGAINGFTGIVGLTVSGLPGGATSSFNPPTVTGAGTTTLSINTACTTPPGSYTLLITGTGGGFTHFASAMLVVMAPSFSISASPTPQAVTAGGTAGFTVTVTPGANPGGCTIGPVNLSVMGAPGGTSFSPPMLTVTNAPMSSTLTASTMCTTPPGTYMPTITGTSAIPAAAMQSTTVSLNVNDFFIAINTSPGMQSVVAGGTVTYTVTVTPGLMNPGNCNVGPVQLTVTGAPGPTNFNPGSLTLTNAPMTSTLTVDTICSTTPGPYTLKINGTGGNFFVSTNPPVGLTVLANTCNAPTTVNIISTLNPKLFGQTITFTGTVAPVPPATGTPTGTLTFTLKEPTGPPLTICPPVTLISGSATCTTDPLPIGMDTITGTYSGDTNFTASSGNFVETVVQAGTTTMVSSSQNPVVVGQPLNFTATVTPQFNGTPTGNVNFYDAAPGATCAAPGASTLLATNGVANGTSTVGPLTLQMAGMRTILGCYVGDMYFTGSSGTFTETVNKASTTTSVISSQNPSDFGGSVTFTAFVGVVAPSLVGGNISGTVTFTIDGTPGSPISLSGGDSVTTSSLTVGTHTVTAAYSGDSNYNGSDSTGSPLTQTVNPALAIISRTAFGVPPDALLGFPYSQALEVTGGSGGLTWTIPVGDFTNNVGNNGTACQGFSLNGATGVLSGIPSILGTCASGGSGSFFVLVEDAAHGTASVSLNILVRDRFAYISGPGGQGPNTDDSVEVINTGTKTFVSSIDATVPGATPAGIAATRNGRFALVPFNFTSMFNRSQFLVIDTTMNTSLGPFFFNTCTGPKGVAIGTVPVATIAASPAGASRASGEVTITTSAAHGLSTDEVVAISGVADSSFDGIFQVAGTPSLTTFTYFQNAPDATSGSGGGVVSSDRAYVACSNGELAVIDVASSSGAPVDLTPASLTSIGSPGATFDGVAITPDGSQVFATDTANGQVVVVATATNTAATGSPFTACTNPKGIAVTPAGDRAYVACDAQAIAVITTASDAVATMTAGTTGTNWNDVASTPDGTRVYITSANGGQFTVIDNTLATPAPIPTSSGSIAIPQSALQGVIVPPLGPVPAGGLAAFIADSTTTPTLASKAEIRDDAPNSFPADATASVSLTAGALNPVAGVRIGVASIPVPYLFIATQSLSPAPVASTPYTSAPLAAGGGVGALTWNATLTGAGCGSLAINSSTGVISGTPGAAGSGVCSILVNVSDATQQRATMTLSQTF